MILRKLVVNSLSVAVLAGAGAPAAALSIDAYLGYKLPLRTAIAPDGKQVAFEVEVNDLAADRQRTEIWIAAAKNSEAQRVGEGKNPQWCGSSLIFLADEGNTTVLHSWSQNRPASPIFQTFKNVTSFRCDVSGSRIALLGQPVDGVGPAPDLFIADSTGSNLRKVTTGVPISAFDWSPDGSAFAVSSAGELDIVTADGKQQPLVHQPGRDETPRWSPDGRSIAFVSQGGKAIGPLTLAVVSAAGGAPHSLATSYDAWTSGQAPRWFDWQNDQSLLFTGLKQMRTHVYRTRVDRPAEATDLTPGDDMMSGCSIAARARAISCIASSLSRPSEITLGSLDGLANLRPITALNPGVTTDAVLSEVSWASPDGTTISGLLALPRDAKLPLPLVVLNIGSHGIFDHSFTTRLSADEGWFPAINHHLLTAAGYAVFMPNPRGSWGYGYDFQAKIAGDPAIGPFNDIDSGVDYLVARGVAKSGQVAIVGTGTYDSYRIAYGLTRVQRYRGAILTVPVVDLTSAFVVGGGAFSERYLGGSPIKDPTKFDAINPIRNIAGYKTPTLLFTVDAPGLREQGNLMFEALRQNGVDVARSPAAETFDGSPKPSALRKAAETGLEFLAKHLQSDFQRQHDVDVWRGVSRHLAIGTLSVGKWTPRTNRHSPLRFSQICMSRR